MTRISVRIGAAVLAFGAPSLAFAHPGLHASGFSAGLAHPVTGLDHLLAMVAVGVWAAALGGAARWIVPAAFVALMALGALLGVNAAGLPAVEHMVAASVVALGLLIAFRAKLPAAWAAALVGLFALFHGYAHGAEAPQGMSLAIFGVGFMAMTAGLHIAGLGVGTLLRDGIVQRLAGALTAAAGVALAVVH